MYTTWNGESAKYGFCSISKCHKLIWQQYKLHYQHVSIRSCEPDSYSASSDIFLLCLLSQVLKLGLPLATLIRIPVCLTSAWICEHQIMWTRLLFCISWHVLIMFAESGFETGTATGSIQHRSSNCILHNICLQ